MLSIEGLVAGYREVRVLHGVCLEVNAGQVVTLLGANGAGKTTLLRTTTGLLAAGSGRIVLNGETLNGMPAHEIVERGLIMVPEGRSLFPFMTVEENLELGSYAKRARVQRRRNLDRVYDLLPRLKERRQQLGCSRIELFGAAGLEIHQLNKRRVVLTRLQIILGVLRPRHLFAREVNPPGPQIFIHVANNIGGLQSETELDCIFFGRRIAVAKDLDAHQTDCARDAITIDPQLLEGLITRDRQIHLHSSNNLFEHLKRERIFLNQKPKLFSKRRFGGTRRP